MHRVLIGVVVFGAVIIAGIGFAGSYAAVRELAIKKGFGDFSYVFPIGIDAGICVLLALDLLLTWIRIPFPLLRQTAWLLTAATIAFNGAAAWPDPLGVGMHGVIPILFVVSVEAARHAIGRIADITADKHMEGVRLTRWLLSPVPTFLLWRRMKLWELRSYEQVIKLEQERLVYQARLRSRFGRAWRRKAPVESLMPLRLARYGVPLADTAPAGLAAAGIRPATPTRPGLALAPSPHATPEASRQRILGQGAVAGRSHPTPRPTHVSDPHVPAESAAERLTTNDMQVATRAWIRPVFSQQLFLRLRGPYIAGIRPESPTINQRANPLPHTPKEPAASSTDRRHGSRHYLFKAGIRHRQEDSTADRAPNSGSSGSGSSVASARTPTAHIGGTARDRRDRRTTSPDTHDSQVQPGVPRPHPPEDDSALHNREPGKRPALTKADRYYLAWNQYQKENGQEPTAEQLSAYLADKGMFGRGQRPVSPANLRRYLLPYRIYTIWAQHREHTDNPSLNAIAAECARRGITAQYNKPITAQDLIHQAPHFEQRWQNIAHHKDTVPQQRRHSKSS
ncbi:DUF2637 domain-containing protein [Streptomyces broussonetiae]|uniref:DUF2637 domain-containing protein n=1 Tax=Streptomyces broussonetiae TaxID=2686304 RepID=A0ABV5EHR8_9ACTN